MIISAVQFRTGDAENIEEKGLFFIEKALKEKPDFIVLQEFFNTIYFPQYMDDKHFSLAAPIPGKLTDKVLRIIKGSETTVIAPIFERSGSEYYCSAAVLDSRDGYLGTYRKLHIPSVESIFETYFFKEGDVGHRVFKLRQVNIAVMLCYDRHFPESARIYGLKDADVIFVCSATPKAARKVWLIELQAHAFSNAIPVACANRTGTEDKIEFLGTSVICDHKGGIIAKADEDEDEIITAELNVDEVRKAKKELSFYKDRRPQLYKSLSE
ncbi:MAG: hypothetical protein AMS17_19445 [Spirochaetes bacterium DG_61]|nr:MAG: hypothetical protein AMS17_19445 [Spirochaetes bacterium DG_61]